MDDQKTERVTKCRRCGGSRVEFPATKGDWRTSGICRDCGARCVHFTMEDADQARALDVIHRAREDCSSCSHWPPDEDTFECRSECLHRGTCEALHAMVQSGQVILLTVHKSKEDLDRAMSIEEVSP